MNMVELIKIQTNEKNQQLVSARELHNFLESKRQFSDWIKDRITNFDFVENEDFTCVSQKNETQRTDGQKGVTVSKEYIITIDMAKELAMVENNEKGKIARKYFIECEKKLKESLTFKLPQTYKEALQELLIKVEENEQLLLENNQMKPKAEFYDIVVGSSKLIDVGETAKIINIKGVGRNKLFEILREKNILMGNNIPYQKYVDMEVFEIIETTKNTPKGNLVFTKTMVTQKGLDYITKILKDYETLH